MFMGIDRRHATFLAFVLLSTIVFFHPLAVVLGHVVSVDHYSHILFVAPLTPVLVYLSRKRVFAVSSYCVPGAWLYLLSAAAFGWILWEKTAVDPSTYISLSILLFAMSCIDGFLFCYGAKAFRAALFPLLFLLLMAPMPDWLLNRTITFLQYASASVTGWFFTAVGVPFMREGVVISLPSVTIEIAQECSGIRSSMILFLAGMVLAYLFLSTSWGRLVATLAIVPLTIIKNGLRIFTLVMLGTRVNPSFLTGRLHHEGGVVFFAAAFVMMWAIIWLLQRAEGRARTAGFATPRESP
jgi:exosortase